MDVEVAAAERATVRDRGTAGGSATSSESGKSKRSNRSVRLNNAANLSKKPPSKTYHKNCFISNDLQENKYFKKSSDFLDTLDAKLRDLEPQNGKKKKGSSLDNRPMFITTVKTGIFLEPPPDIAALLGLRHSSSSASSANGTDLLMYSYSSQPRILNNSKKKQNNTYSKTRNKRETTNHNNNYINKNKDGGDAQPLPYGNIMFDRRVVRGPAFVQHPIPTAGVESQAAREAEARRRAMARRKAQRARILKLRVGTPPPVEGRKHEPVQTETYLEEVVDHPVEMVAETQTELMLDRPESPVYVPAKSGVDTSTQIQPGELFDFDMEVGPMLEVLVGKTLEQALVEVMEEEELEAVRIQQREFKEARDAELAEEQRLQEQDIRRKREMEERVREHEDAIQSQNEAKDRVAAAVITTGYLDSLLPDVVQGLKDSGQVPDPIQQEIEEGFMSWLLDEVRGEIQRVIQAEDFITVLVKDILRMREDVAKDEGSDIPDEEPPADFLALEEQELIREEEEEKAVKEGEQEPNEIVELDTLKEDTPGKAED